MPSLPSLITATGISKSFTSVKAVQDLSFTIHQNEIFALLGPNGAGKTTSVRMLAGITRPDSGTIAYPTIPRAELKLGYLPEERGLYQDQNVLRILGYFGRLNGMSGAEVSEQGLYWLERLGLQDRATDQLQTLSKGNQQKVQFIATVLHKPNLLILDEPFSGLDPVNQDFFLDLIEELRQAGATIVLSAHQMNLVEQIADRILVIDHGRPALSGTMAEIRQQASSSEKIVCRVHDDANIDTVIEALDACPSLLRTEKLPGSELAAWIAPDVTLAVALGELCSVAPVTAVNSAQVSLHEIFIETVGRHAAQDGGAA